jgi:hypothetical protein
MREHWNQEAQLDTREAGLTRAVNKVTTTL